MIHLESTSPTQWRLKGKLNVETINQILAPGHAMIDAVPASAGLILDFSEVKHADSASLALMLDWMRYAKRQNKQIDFVNITEKMKQIIRVSNLGDVFKVSD